jgi:hypothetical protein
MKEVQLFRLIFTAILICQYVFASSAETLVVGTVRNQTDKLPLEAVNVYFEGTKKGTQTDDEGFFMLKSEGNESTLIFSSVGYKTRKIKIKPGETNGVNIELQEDINLLNEFFVLPGINPALDIMKKVWQQNQETKRRFALLNPTFETQLSIFRKLNPGRKDKKIDEMLFNDNGFQRDSTRYLLLYQIKGLKGKMTDTTAYTSFEKQDNFNILLERFTGEINKHLDFTEKSMTLFSRTFVSPLAPNSTIHYRFYLSDSLIVDNKKTYKIRYFSKNPAISAFNGEITVDSVSMGVIGINATLPGNINLNYIRKMEIYQRFQFLNNTGWIPQDIRLLANLDYKIGAAEEEKDLDGVHYFINKKFYQDRDTSIVINSSLKHDAINTQYQDIEIDSDLQGFIKTAQWIADAVVTGYIRAGKFDIGKINQLARLTENEGFRMNIPFRTNENLFKKMSFGGYGGISTLDGQLSYGLEAGLKLPGVKKSVLSFQYVSDRHIPDYNLNNYVIREDPFYSTDEALFTTIFAFRKGGVVTPRKTLEVQWMKDWSSDFETSVYFRNQRFFNDVSFPLFLDGQQLSSINIQSLTFFARYSTGEKTYEDHLQRIYLNNNKPVWTFFAEIGKPTFATSTTGYFKVEANVRQTLNFSTGQWNWMIEGGYVAGDVPYFLLKIPVGRQSVNFDRNAYNMMEHREFAMDKYLSLHQELVFNGVILNKIPLVKTLKLREIISLKCLTGSLSSHYEPGADLPINMHAFPGFYAEAGIGISNVFRVFSIQAVRRLTSSDQNKWGLIAGVRVHF